MVPLLDRGSPREEIDPVRALGEGSARATERVQRPVPAWRYGFGDGESIVSMGRVVRRQLRVWDGGWCGYSLSNPRRC